MKPLAFDDTYWIDGKEWPRITNIVKHIDPDSAGLMIWSAGIGFKGALEGKTNGYWAWKDESDKNKNIGSTIHHIIAAKLRGEQIYTDNFDDMMMMLYTKIDKWLTTVKLEPDLIEENVKSEELKCAGTTDFAGKLNSIPTIIDWKTSDTLYTGYAVQVAAYNLCLEGAYNQFAVVSIPKTDDEISVYYVKPKYHEMLYKAFKCARTAYNYFQHCNKMVQDIRKETNTEKRNAKN